MNYDNSIEMQELMNKLKSSGFNSIVDLFMEYEDKVYTKKGRLNKSGACRVLGCKPKQLEEILEQMRETLKTDIS